MGAKKILSYGRSILVMLLVLYLILVWMYFKDNARQLTSSGLLLWFVTTPLLFLGSIMALLWWQKKLDKQTTDTPEILDGTADKTETIKPPDTYQLFVYSRVCLPEGDRWSEVVDNDEDLTVLSENLTDIDGMPMLVKPIARLTDAAALPYPNISTNAYLADSEFDDGYSDSDLDSHLDDDRFTERKAALNETTLRLQALIYEQLGLSEEILSSLAEHFHQHHQKNTTQSNAAIDIHPEWQQHYLVSANEASNANNSSKENSDDTMTAASAGHLANLPIYLCLPASADTAFLIATIKEQLATYGIPDTRLAVTTIMTDGTDAANIVANNSANNTLIATPADFINKHLLPLSKSTVPDLCLILIADSQISEEWLDTYLYSEQMTNVIPTEAGALLLFSNQTAQELLNIDASTSILLTEIGTARPTELVSDKRRYLNHLTAIKNLLIDNTLSLSPTNTTALKATDKQTTKPTKKSSDINNKENYKTNVAIEDMKITAMSDINPLKQPYDLSTYMSFLEAFIAQGALVNEHHLGHYMPLNNWLKPFISLSLFIDLAKEDQQESDRSFLITQHKHCNMLWLADSFQTSD
ncbi:MULTISPECIES: hypothetical protein [Psychrobacter]|uniref:hypothetical protein n=1 Tax=Psychrobacter TaxID=497 RepID=UPI000EE84881|nr:MULTISPECIES: hypothetical protein [Psychrobacter]HCT73415.1 hypothetical protein [Psychrobacter sp.]